jgi:aminoglycoside phosphotransferase (APT) family kinase protein
MRAEARVAEDGTARLRAALAAAGADWSQVTDRRELAGGTFNAVTLVTFASGLRLVVKIPPEPQTPLLRYEQGILGTEALFYRLAGALPGVPVPQVLAVDPGGAAGGYLVMTECPGSPWHLLSPAPAGAERDALRAELGRQVGALHAVAGPGFGYPSGALGPLRASWAEAFGGMIDAVLDDAARYAVTLPRPAAEVRSLFAGHSALLDSVTAPVLVHFDLWDGNILVAPGQGPGQGPRIGGLIDGERTFWGDPLADLVSLALFHDIEADAAFLGGYREAGGKVGFGPEERERIALYRAYLHLIMWTEVVPRGGDEGSVTWLRGFAYEPLAATLDRWAASGGH